MISFSSPINWSKTCAVWIDEIRIGFEVPAPQEIRGGFLRAIRRLTAALAVGVTLSFTLHCTRPPVVATGRGRSSAPSSSVGLENYTEEGVASWYGGNGDGFAGKPTASGERFDPHDLTAAHRTLPLGTLIQVENLDNGRFVTLRVNDRGPFVRGRILDVSKRGAQVLGFSGMAKVRLRAVDAQGRQVPVQTDGSNPYVVQVAALSDPKNIEALKRELEASYGPVSLQDALSADGQDLKRVRVGSYSSRDEAERAAQELARRLKGRGVEPFITRRR